MIPPFWHWRSAEICLGLFWSIWHGIGSLSLALSICISGNLFAFVFNLKTENSNLESGIFLLCCSLTLSAESGEVSWLIALIYNDNGSDRTWDLWASSQQRYIHRKNENRKTDGESAGQGHGCWNPLNIAWAQLLPACLPASLPTLMMMMRAARWWMNLFNLKIFKQICQKRTRKRDKEGGLKRWSGYAN